MGWYGSFNETRKELIAELIEPEYLAQSSRYVLRHCVRGNVLWSVVEIRFEDGSGRVPHRFIACDLMQKLGGYWGHKPLTEEEHPYYYSCPLSYLDMAPEQSPEWRALVRKYHERQLELRRARRRAGW